MKFQQKTQVIIYFILLMLPCMIGNVFAAENVKVLFLRSKNNTSHDVLIQNTRHELVSLNRSKHKINIETATISDTDISRIDKTPNPPDLLVTVGTLATHEVASQKTSTPILSILVPRVSFEKIQQDYRKKNNTGYISGLSSIYLDQPIARRIKFIKLLMPQVKHVGVVLGPSTAHYTKELKSEAKKYGLILHVENVRSENELLGSLSSVLERSQVLLPVIDPLVFNKKNAQTILLTAYRYRVPLIGISPSYIKAGAIAALYTRPEQLSTQLARKILEFSRSSGKGFKKPEFPTDFSVSINNYVARSYGLTVPEESELQKKLKLWDRDEP